MRLRWVIFVSVGFFVFTQVIFAQKIESNPLSSGHDEKIQERENFFIKFRYIPDELIIKFRENAAKKLQMALADGKGFDKIQFGGSFDILKNKFKVKKIKRLFPDSNRNREELEALREKDVKKLNKKQKRLLQRLNRAPIGAKMADLGRIYKLEVELMEGELLEDVLAVYNENPDVEYAELNYVVSINLIPNDPLFPLQWPLNNTGQIYPESGWYNHPPGTPDCDVDAPQAWGISTGLSDVVVAVADTGVYYNHRDIQNNRWFNEAELSGIAGVDDDDNGYIDDIYGYDFLNYDGDPNDDHGHGTHCAGIIAADPNNNLDIAGICWNGKIMSLKFINKYGYGNTADAAAAFYYAVENGADVISNSWGGDYFSQMLQDAIDYAHSQGVIVVAAAGNSNSDDPVYPAACENVISTAATNSNDEKASFSNYGNLVDVAAPGVDILSLRPSKVFSGIAYNNFTSISSGTSMACPYVAGACAALLSANPTLSIGEVQSVIMETGDPIADGICISDKRINLFNALNSVSPSQGRVCFDSSIYSCSSVISIRLGDYDIAGSNSVDVAATTQSGDFETVTLSELADAAGVFTGSISAESGSPDVEDGLLQLSGLEPIHVTYEDADDGTGNAATVTDRALADCIAPVVTNVYVTKVGSGGVVINYGTSERATGYVLYSQSCGGPYTEISSVAELGWVHSVRINGLDSETQYYFVIDVNDMAGNHSRNDNHGACFTFTTLPVMEVFVPQDFNTIQEAIDSLWDGDIVTVTDGVYTGDGNRDIDFRGYAITVRSENGPESCIIDCEGNYVEPHRAFYFNNSEDQKSILDGFTIINGYAEYEGGAINCYSSSPNIKNCVFEKNSAGDFGGAVFNINGSNPVFEGCTFRRNEIRAGGWVIYGGAAVANIYDSAAQFKECSFIRNNSTKDAGAVYNMYSSLELTNCAFIGNFSYYYGGGIYDFEGNLKLVNCIFSGNEADSECGGAIFNAEGDIELINCTLSGNSADCGSGGIANEGKYSGALKNSILWGNSAGGLQDMAAQVDGELLDISYCCIQGIGDMNIGDHNLGFNPEFLDADGLDNITGTEDDNLRLSENSTCLDAGDNSAVPLGILTDLDGDTRFKDEPDVVDSGCCLSPIVDMGAYEGPKQCFLLEADVITVPEEGTNAFTVALATEPNGSIEVSVTVESGDSDITVELDGPLIFDPCNYFQPQVVIVSAAQDSDYLDGEAVIAIIAEDIPTVRITAVEEDNTEVPQVLYVDANASGANNGSGWADAFTELREAVNLAKLHSDIVRQIRVAEGTYKPVGPGGEKNIAFQLLNNLVVYGGFPSGGGELEERDYQLYRTILSGDLNDDDEPNFMNFDDNSNFVVRGSGTNPTSVLDGFVITGGRYGGMENYIGSPTVKNCTLSGNKAVEGGGMYNYMASPKMINCLFEENFAEMGGGVYNSFLSRPELSDCIFGNNQADIGGAMANDSSSPILKNCLFIDNSSTYLGGAILNLGDSAPELTACSFINNSTEGNGGGVFSENYSNPVLIGCIFSGNTACWGGGMYNDGYFPDLIVINSTFYGNDAVNLGGGMFSTIGRGTILVNCIFWDNSDQDGSLESSQINGGSTMIDYSCVQGWTGSLGGVGNIGEEPLFADAPADDFHLKSQAGRWIPAVSDWVIDDVMSPCIDSGYPYLDLGLELWPHGKRINMGAFGGTLEASLSNSIAGNLADLNNDGVVNFDDFSYFADMWLSEVELAREDLDRNKKVDIVDFELFSGQWLWED